MRKLATLGVLCGTLFAWSTASAQFFPSTGGPFVIPDRGATGCGPPLGPAVTNSITATGPGNVADLDILINVTHTWIGDLTMTVSNGATSVIIMDRPGGTTDTSCGDSSDGSTFWADDEGTDGSIETAPVTPGSTAPAYTAGGRYTPNNPLSAFDGSPIAGTWTIAVSDAGGGDTGTLNAWGLAFNGVTAGEDGASDRANTLELLSGNPAEGHVRFSLTVAEAQEVRVGLYDLLGRSVRPVLDRALTAGSEVLMEVNVADLAAGVYVLRAEGEHFNRTRTLTVR